ncbi:hypothetical protein SC499_21905 [Peribacillus simplex]|uniref:hypothetical protein n=1 Tax=Peribacillus simplex TaxID=1478 RepID=UPI00298DE618|nr:hypothetical protein [Peribacillus simplex]MDW7617259.1 hypothetical protein [Peribacillus simplex]
MSIRYADIYKGYVESDFKAIELDRNQIIRLALFVAAHTSEYKTNLEKYKFPDVPLDRLVLAHQAIFFNFATGVPPMID